MRTKRPAMTDVRIAPPYSLAPDTLDAWNALASTLSRRGRLKGQESDAVAAALAYTLYRRARAKLTAAPRPQRRLRT